MDQHQTAWRKIKYHEKFLNAFRGIYVMCKTTRHFYMHVLAGLIAATLGYYFSISAYEWIAIIFSIGLVIITEAINTAIEIDIDLTSPEYHPFARDTKDVAAGAVLLSAIFALAVGLVIFLPKIF